MSLTKMFEHQELARLAFDYIVKTEQVEAFTDYVLSRTGDFIRGRVAECAAEKQASEHNSVK